MYGLHHELGHDTWPVSGTAKGKIQLGWDPTLDHGIFHIRIPQKKSLEPILSIQVLPMCRTSPYGFNGEITGCNPLLYKLQPKYDASGFGC